MEDNTQLEGEASCCCHVQNARYDAAGQGKQEVLCEHQLIHAGNGNDDGHSDSNANCDSDRNSNCDSDRNPDCHANSNANPGPNCCYADLCAERRSV